MDALTVGSPELEAALDRAHADMLRDIDQTQPDERAPVDAEAAEFLKLHGYPVDAKRLPAGTYRLTGVSAWNQPDESSPDGVRLRARGDLLTLTEDEASRLLHIGAIADPDAPPPEPATVPVARQMQALLDDMRARVVTHREKSLDRLTELQKVRDAQHEEIEKLSAQVAELDDKIAALKRLPKASDDEIAQSFGDAFHSTMKRLERNIAELQET